MARLLILLSFFFTYQLCTARQTVGSVSIDSALYYYYGGNPGKSLTFIKPGTHINDSMSCMEWSINSFALFDQQKFKQSEEQLKRLLAGHCPRAIRLPALALLANLKFINNKVDSAVLLTKSAIQEARIAPAGRYRDQLLAGLYLNLGYFSTPRTMSKNYSDFGYIMEYFDHAENYLKSSSLLSRSLFSYLYLYRALAYYNCGYKEDQVSVNLRKAYDYHVPSAQDRGFSEISGYLFYSLNHIDEAVEFLKDSELNPWYGMALIKSNRVEEGLELLDDIIRSSESHPFEKSETFYFLSEYYLQKNNVKALEFFRLAKEYEGQTVALEYSVYYINKDADNDFLNEKFNTVINELNDKREKQDMIIILFISVAVLFFGFAIFYIIIRKRNRINAPLR